MLLNAVLRSEFEPVIRARGEDYLRRGRIRSVVGNDEGVIATVSGSREYTVRVGRDGDDVELSCTCPYFDSDGACKHLWAVLLLAGERGFLRGDGRPVRAVRLADAAYTPPARPAWESALEYVSAAPAAAVRPLDWPAGRELLYVVDVAASRTAGVTVELFTRDAAVRGGFRAPRPLSLTRGEAARLSNIADRRVLALLSGARRAGIDAEWAENWDRLPTAVVLRDGQAPLVLPDLCAEGRCVVMQEGADGTTFVPLGWDDGLPWQLVLVVGRDRDKDFVARGFLRRAADERPLAEPEFLTRDGVLLMGGRFGRWVGGGSFGWVVALRRDGELLVPASGLSRLLEALAAGAVDCEVELPEDLAVTEADGPPIPHLRLELKPAWAGAPPLALGKLAFAYGPREVDWGAPGGLLLTSGMRLAHRNTNAEAEAAALLERVGFVPAPSVQGRLPAFAVDSARLPDAVRELLAAGWRVEAEGRQVRAGGAAKVSVTSGVDWFDLKAEVDFGGIPASLPELLAALRGQKGWVTLGDGSLGLLPEEWLRRHELLAGMGQAEGGRIRFHRGQLALLDAFLASEPGAKSDALFKRSRKALARFAGAVPLDPPATFRGRLRPYQREGLGWMTALRDLGFGGCLADDMGLGKTVQVLALLDGRRARKHGPSLVVVPRSLVFNWKDEAARFTPRLSVLDYSGPGRGRTDPSRHDVVLTTYGTLKRDLAELKAVDWDYVVLDEAQAVKNAATAGAKAVRALKAKHRLALSGTPVENHLGELWSLLDFLNPGIMGKASAFAGKAARDPDERTRELLARAVRPFILRRTKEKVARDLPAKVEQTVVCEMGATQRRLYGELKDHYRRTLLEKVDRIGIARSKIHVLEALLRLRQAACHPGLLDARREDEESAKLEALLPQLAELVAEGHKALVFSQFTSFLALVRKRLDVAGIAYEYLDGRTRDRGARVARFQSDAGGPIFLVSLKAGGLGLNLTAAGYVFILDPWWNPAAEAQAVDRTHRIGQSRTVFAYRLITKDTIEERVAELQKSKKRLAESILTEDAGLLQTLKREDLELLLS
ncbi:MAG: DEAD/DEAH box helicase [Thermoanaerobaculia bacterium]